MLTMVTRPLHHRDVVALLSLSFLPVYLNGVVDH